MANEPPKGLVEAMAKKPPVSKDRLDALKAKIGEMHDFDRRIQNGEAVLADLKEKRRAIAHETLPSMMEGIQIPSLIMESGGNEPPIKAVLKPYYRASIPSENAKENKWTPEKREEAFAYLKTIGHDDLIKITVTWSFPAKTPIKLIEMFCKTVAKLKIKSLKIPAPTIDRGVHWATLTSWLKNQVEVHKFIPDLDKIGGTVGKVVEIETLEG